MEWLLLRDFQGAERVGKNQGFALDNDLGTPFPRISAQPKMEKYRVIIFSLAKLVNITVSLHAFGSKNIGLTLLEIITR